jgi:tetratricopeptide (TPR) repeat protein
MGKLPMLDKDKINEKDIWEEFQEKAKEFWAFPAWIIGISTVIFQYVSLWQGSREVMTYVFLVLAGMLVISGLVWIGFRQKKTPISITRTRTKYIKNPYYQKSYKIARILLGCTILAGLVLTILYFEQQRKLEENFVILVTQIEGPNPEKYRVTEEVLVKLTNEFSSDNDIRIMLVDEQVNIQKSDSGLKGLENKYRADLIIWGWYGITDSAVRLHISLYAPKISLHQYAAFNGLDFLSAIYQTPVNYLDSFELQLGIGDDISVLIHTLNGLILIQEYSEENYLDAIGEFDKALEGISQFGGLKISELQLLFEKTSLHLQLNDIEKAKEGCEQSLLIDEDGYYSHLICATFYNYLEDFPNASDHISQAMESDIDDTLVYYVRGHYYLNQLDFEKAIKDYHFILENQKSSIEAFRLLGGIYLQINEFSTARDYLSQYIKENPYDYNAYHMRAISYLGMGKHNKALRDVNIALRKSNGNLGYMNTKGVIYSMMNKLTTAKRIYSTIITKDNTNAIAYGNRASVYGNMGQFRKSLEDANIAIALEPKAWNYYALRSQAHFYLDDIDSARNDLVIAISLVDDGEVKLELQEILESYNSELIK